jgi:predicted nucleotidyltransferase
MAASPHDTELAREFGRRLSRAIGENNFTVTLFGSRARGGGDAESDLDLFVMLDHDDVGGRVRNAALDVACELTLESGILVSPIIGDRRFLAERKGFSFLEAIKREGIRL